MSTLSYLIFSILAFFLIKNKLIDEYAVWLIPLGVMMIIRDLTPFLGTLRTVGHRVLSFQAVSQQYRSGVLSGVNMCLIFNRIILFPTLFVGYLLLKLFLQLDISAFSLIISEKPWIEYGLIFLIVISGILTLVRESIDDTCYKNESNPTRTKLSLSLTLILSLFTSIIIFRQTASIGILSVPVSVIAGLILYLVGILLLQQE